MLPPRRLLLVLALLAPLPAAADTAPAAALPPGSDAVIGGRAFTLPDTPALQKSGSAGARDFATRLLTPGKRLLAVWTDAAHPARGERYAPVRFRYAVAYTMVPVEQLEASADDFGYARLAVRDEISALTETAAVRLPDTLAELAGQLEARQQDLGTAARAGRPVAVELLQDDARRIGYLALQAAPQRDAPEGAAPRWLMGCMNTLLLKGKLVQVNVFSEFEDAADTRWLRAECARLVGAVQSRN